MVKKGAFSRTKVKASKLPDMVMSTRPAIRSWLMLRLGPPWRTSHSMPALR